jgi:hypothetical protein
MPVVTGQVTKAIDAYPAVLADAQQLQLVELLDENEMLDESSRLILARRGSCVLDGAQSRGVRGYVDASEFASRVAPALARSPRGVLR